MKIYRVECHGGIYSIVDNEDGGPLVVRQIGGPPENNGIYTALHLIEAWRQNGKPGELLADPPP